MSKRSLGILAIVLILLMAMIVAADLDGLPQPLRQSAENSASLVARDRGSVAANSAAVTKALAAEPALFRSRAADWRNQLAKSQEQLKIAERQAVALQELGKENDREDRQKVEAGLSSLESTRKSYLATSGNMRAEAERWLGYKRDLPGKLNAMAASYTALQALDIEAATQAAGKAATDWPAKSNDLLARRQALAGAKTRGVQAWEQSAAAREQAAQANPGDIDYATLIRESDRVQAALQEVRRGSEALNRMAGQLYTGWDKLLLELDDEDEPTRQKMRLVRTRYPDASLQNGQTSQEERWEPVLASSQDLERKVGLVVERKPPGKYDSEAERTVQPPAYAYVAPPGQANSYGSWSNGVWQWLPQYLLLSQLLRTPSYPTIGTGDYNNYDQARRRGDVYYGRNGYRGGVSGAGSSARRALEGLRNGDRSSNSSRRPGDGFYRERPRDGDSGFGSSRYRSRGGYSGSQYESRGSSNRSSGYRSYSRGRSGGFRGGRR